MDERSVLEVWLDDLPDEEIQREMDEWEARLHEASVEYQKRKEVLDLKRRWRERYSRPEVPTSRTTVSNADEAPSETLFPDRPASIRESVLAVFAASPSIETWTIPEIRDALIKRGWMENTEPSMRSLQSALSRMRAEGRVVRVRHGVYKSAALEAASALAAASGSSEQEVDPD